MINWDKIGDKKKFLISTFCFILTLLIIIYIVIISKYMQRNSFAKQLMEMVEKNKDTTFSIEKVYLCSSANAIDNSEEYNMKELDIYQYTDIAIYIDNFADENGITNKNTIKELYIDNIDLISNGDFGEQKLAYTNLLKVGNREAVTDFSSSDRIDFNIVYTNEENERADYTQPTFYTDCSNPITLKYINNLETNYSIAENEAVNFDGTLLKRAGISTADIDCKIKFKINIVNNDDEYYSCWLNLKIPLDDIYEGTTIKSATMNGSKYNFFTI